MTVTQIDVAALWRSTVRTTPWQELLIPAGLLLLFIFSFVGGWIRYSGLVYAGIAGTYTSSGSYDSLWDGFGYLPALLIVVAILFWVFRRIPQLRLELPVPDSVIWMGFAAGEVVLFLLHWVIDNGLGGTGYTTMPGWTAFCAIVFAGVVAAGGFLQYRKGPRLSFGTLSLGRARATGAVPGAGGAATSARVGSLSPDRAHWWDGTAWRDAATSVPPGAPRSEDGGYWWDGAAWRPAPR